MKPCSVKFKITSLSIFSILLSVLTDSSLSAQQSLSDTIEIEEVVVTGTKIEVARKNVPLTVSVITHEEIEQSGESALLPVISQQVPGVFITERGITGFGVADGAAGQINIRGLGGNPTTQVLILIDGHPQFMGTMGHHLPDAYVSSDAEKVEIIRGPASILYGSNAFGGVINIITRKQHSDGYTVNAKAVYGSFDTRKLSLSGGMRRKNLDLFASVNHDQTDGHRDSSDFAITNAYFKTGYKLNKHLSAMADFSLAHFETSDPGLEASIAGERIDILRGKTALSVENNFNSLEGALKIFCNFGEHDITDGWHSNDVLYGMMFYQGLKLMTNSTLTAGYDYMNFGGTGSPIVSVIRDEDGRIIPGPSGPQFVTSEYDNKWINMQNHAFYISYQHLIRGIFSINTGLRYEINKTYTNELIPQAGFAWHASSNTTIKGSVSKGYRPPSIRELYFFPPANDNLQPEKLMNYEASWIQSWYENRIKTELTTYLVKGENRIIMVPAIAPPPPIYRNTGEFSNMGIEFSGTVNLTRNLKFHANYAFIHMETPLPGTPQHNLFASANYRFRKINLNISVQNISDLYADIRGETAVLEKNYTVVGAMMKYRLTRYFNLFFNADNLLNQTYYINNGYPMPGINFSGGFNLNFRSDFKAPLKFRQ
ncbi:MAG: TonB-dependent receptor [Bacteroidales bacterium]|nr:TonB-dependent receptor [Bacteroidales bacterium]